MSTNKEYRGGFENLEVWKEARKYRTMIRSMVDSFPYEEKFMLKSQLLRSARSVTANIAEGYGRYHYQENIQFCRFARGSLNETLDHLICAHDEKYIDESKYHDLRKTYNDILRLLNGYILYLRIENPKAINFYPNQFPDYLN